jgi:DNA-binding LacI/PurR family transcriptional regulator
MTRELTAQLFASGHSCVGLIQEHTSILGWERSRLGFEYAHHACRVRFRREHIIRIDRRRCGLRPALKQLLMLGPTGMLVQNAVLLEHLWSRADRALQKKLAQMEIIVLSPDRVELLTHPAKMIQWDPSTTARITVQVLVDVLNGRTPRKRHHDLPWTLISRL